ncbi:hypothetical protein Sxan_19920 [Streptomyces xanthophaeus]|uniref:Uncharacterized protein n=1 Tax=Streptomyces xanthophaeus TaxID=67385 RepID=A0A919GTV0_9ACTN|nr:hypothetical protein Sxan_19920 [Streptomyces xanthophaeus]
MVPAKCQAQPAQMGHPLRLEPLPQPVRAGSDYAEQTDSPVMSCTCLPGIVPSPVTHPYVPAAHPYGGSGRIFTQSAAVAARTLDRATDVLHQYRHETPARRLSTWRVVSIMDDHRGNGEKKD